MVKIFVAVSSYCSVKAKVEALSEGPIRHNAIPRHKQFLHIRPWGVGAIHICKGDRLDEAIKYLKAEIAHAELVGIWEGKADSYTVASQFFGWQGSTSLPM